MISITGFFEQQLYTGFIGKEKTLTRLYYQPLAIMNKQLSCLLLVTSIFAFNAIPVQAAAKQAETSTLTKQLVTAFRGQWCFEVVGMGLLCYQV